MKNLVLLSITACGLTFTSCEKPEVISTTEAVAIEQGANAAAHAARQAYSLDESSAIEWWGSGPEVTHHGSFAVTAQDLEVVDGKVTKGRFIIPIASIQNFDLPGNIKPVLLDHLKSPDFFNMLRYPEASFSFGKLMPMTKAAEGAVAGANYMVSGDFTLLGKTLPISFPARVHTIAGQLAIEAKLQLDRTRWGMNYAADPALGDHHIYPTVALHLSLKGQKQ